MAKSGKVYRGLSIIEQAPLGGYKAPPSPLSFKLWLVVLWRIILLRNYLGLRLSIVGYLIPVWVLAIVSSKVVKSLSLFIFICNYYFLQLSCYLILFLFNVLITLYAGCLLVWVNRMTAVAGTKFTNPRVA